jgi:hypothetical protein
LHLCYTCGHHSPFLKGFDDLNIFLAGFFVFAQQLNAELNTVGEEAETMPWSVLPAAARHPAALHSAAALASCSQCL